MAKRAFICGKNMKIFKKKVKSFIFRLIRGFWRRYVLKPHRSLLMFRSLLIVHRSLLIVHRSLLIAYRSLLIVHRSLLIVKGHKTLIIK